MGAFCRVAMPEGLTADQLWKVCLDKITELLPNVVNGRKSQIRLKQIDAEINACQQRIDRFEFSGQEPYVIEDEKRGQLLKMQQLEAQKQLLVTLNHGEA